MSPALYNTERERERETEPEAASAAIDGVAVGEGEGIPEDHPLHRNEAHNAEAL
jgi:hypothetical protein